jgi:hypothetical protein
MILFLSLQFCVCLFFLLFSKNFIGTYTSLLSLFIVAATLLSQYLEDASLHIITIVLFGNIFYLLMMSLNRNVDNKRKHIEERN